AARLSHAACPCQGSGASGDRPRAGSPRRRHGDFGGLSRREGRVPLLLGIFGMARELIKRGWYLGFTGVITFKNARKAVEVAQWAPLNRLLVETDCPYMAPEPYRGQRSDSTMIPRMVEKIAELRGL